MVIKMFNNFSIKKEGQEEILYLYLDLNTEFGNIKSEPKTTINKEVKNYIKKNKINFKGSKVVLMLGSIMIGCLLYNAPLNKKELPNPNYNYTVEILSNNLPTINEEAPIEEPIKIEVDKIPTKVETTTKKPTTNNSTTANINKNKPTNTNTANINKPNNASSSSTPTPPSKPAEETKPPITTPTKQLVTIYRNNGSILNIELEEYLIGVVASEMPASFHIEALKAQAIAARTYALKAIENGTRLTDTVSTQVYKDNNELKKTWGSSFNTYYNKVKSAVDATSGLVMTYNNTLINAYYHSTSNGYTEDSTAVFGSYPYLKSVESSVDKNVSSYLRTITMTYEDISNKLGVPVTSLSSINIERNNSERVDKIIIDNHIYGGVEFRTKLGLRSTDFDITLNENNITVTTRGFGHGVGMSQYGANEYAKIGLNYEQILKHYYTGITIKKN